ncbi:hypothetical protein EX895_001563 [Sporisorium graminicola]|uniref:Intradiol ring-cleavage dioxygenases domain-containing protein n=1 Tax=Sporisorium graminicola TaxID=280036 RepID=A0A4U7L1D7_9BASI|nr:hypothetical protein EX895_001563 [Sporisorium graminicola]TKY89032.1 hypothetical protein EX895_001563 [Sporisorium graminicola]
MLFNTQVLSRWVVLVAAVAVAVVSAHPGEAPPSPAEVAAGQLYRRSAQSQYRRCANSKSSLQRRHALHTQQQRRQELLDQLRARTLARRADSDDAATKAINSTHLSNRTDITREASTGTVFSSDPEACVLQPEAIIGPYWVSGELVRSNVTDGQAGVPLYLDAQFVDVNTCEPVPELYWEIWSCNATGVYSGVQASGNGNPDDASNLNATFLRGVQRTDENGASQFQTIFPGHYTGRTTHIHIVAHVNATLLGNNTLANAQSTGAVHIGQLFFDQDLINQVETTSPYTTNTQELTTNADDFILLEEAASEGSDPIVEYVLLGDKIEDGIFAWTTVAVDVDAKYTTDAASTWTENGGVANSGGQFQGPPGQTK